MKRQDILFCVLGPVIALLVGWSEAYIAAAIETGLHGQFAGRTRSLYTYIASGSFFLLYALSMVPAYVSSRFFTKMQAAQGVSSGAWFLASILVMVLGPAMGIFMVIDGPLAMAGALVSATVATLVCGSMSQQFRVKAASYFT